MEILFELAHIVYCPSPKGTLNVPGTYFTKGLWAHDPNLLQNILILYEI